MLLKTDSAVLLLHASTVNAATDKKGTHDFLEIFVFVEKITFDNFFDEVAKKL